MAAESDCSAQRRVVIFTGRPASASTVETVEALTRAHPQWRLLVVQGAAPVDRRRWLRRKLRRLAREPLSYPMELLCERLARLRLRRGRVIGGRVRLPGLAELAGERLAHREFADIHSPEAMAAVREFEPWLGISIGAPILKQDLFALPERGTINIHKSLLPNYRGMPPGFWELHDGADRTGVSIHWMAPGLDTGEVITQRALAIGPTASWTGVRIRLDTMAIELLLAAAGQIDAGTAESQPQGEAETPTRGKPSWLVERRVRGRLASRRAAQRTGASALRRAAKTAALWAYVRLWAPLRNLVRAVTGRCHTTILLYHRVSDEYLDSVSIGVEQFDRQLAMLRRSYDVCDMASYLADRGRPRRRPAVVLTFDDGYEDNYDAAKLLRRRGLPCTFFVCTRIVGTDRPFPHDAKRLGKTVPALDWDQVRRMRDWGHHVAIHTASHANVGELPVAESLVEIGDSMADLRRELGDPTDSAAWFAYPYGRPKDMSDDVRRGLAELAVRYCFSAYGGINGPEFDPLDILRQGIDYQFSDLAFRAVVEGWQLRGR